MIMVMLMRGSKLKLGKGEGRRREMEGGGLQRGSRKQLHLTQRAEERTWRRLVVCNFLAHNRATLRHQSAVATTVVPQWCHSGATITLHLTTFVPHHIGTTATVV